jgi:hypothetical protein
MFIYYNLYIFSLNLLLIGNIFMNNLINLYVCILLNFLIDRLFILMALLNYYYYYYYYNNQYF